MEREDLCQWHNGHMKKVGEILGKTYCTIRDPSTFFRIFDGFGLSDWVIEQLLEKGVTDVLIEYKGATGTRYYQTKTMEFIKHGDYYWFKANNEEQQVLKLEFFTEIKNKQD